ncbi:LPS export ABC transporter periplasmic protein LptC [Sulfurospirillum arcachonense]|uniref:LPS export ABC transporter periplasmic protein LptC n=1 Tax=Sulfurospirillum arcachonense TaxID=57666 RepID=UPI0004697E08|nr:LPS export ABC transporter periplasmic protein LptC [Sulfurospirillum arcachonense]
MAVKLLYYFVFAFIAIMTFLLYQKPYQVNDNLNNKKEANIEMIDVVNYSISQNGISHIVNAKKVLRYNDHDEFYKIDTIRKSKENFYDNLRANSGKLVKDDLELFGNVRYQNSDNVKFSSEVAQYNLKTKIFKTNAKFILEDNSTITHGTSLIYQTKDGKIEAHNIKSNIEVADK